MAFSGYDIKQSSTESALVFGMFDVNGNPAAGLSPTVLLSKNGGAFASPSGAVTEIANGFYKVAPNATDTGTLGPLALYATGTNAVPAAMIYNIVAYDPQSATNLGLSALPTASPASSGGLPTVGTGSGQINPNGSGAVPVSSGTVTTVSGNVNGS